jgi:hypothetical protein
MTAARTIQQAIAAGTTPGRLVLVTNGIYQQTPGVIVYGSMYNNLALTNPVVVQSVNGPGPQRSNRSWDGVLMWGTMRF